VFVDHGQDPLHAVLDLIAQLLRVGRAQALGLQLAQRRQLYVGGMELLAQLRLLCRAVLGAGGQAGLQLLFECLQFLLIGLGFGDAERVEPEANGFVDRVFPQLMHQPFAGAQQRAHDPPRGRGMRHWCHGAQGEQGDDCRPCGMPRKLRALAGPSRSRAVARRHQGGKHD